MRKVIALGLVGAALLAGCGSATTAQPTVASGGTGTEPTTALDTNAAPTVGSALEPTSAVGTDTNAQPTTEATSAAAAEPTTAATNAAEPTTAATSAAMAEPTSATTSQATAAPTTAAGTEGATQPTTAPAGSTTGNVTLATEPVTIPELGISFNPPQGWVQDAEANTWSPNGSGLPLFGVNSADVTSDWKPSSFLPQGADVTSTQMLTLPSGSINLYLVENTDGTAESHAVMRNGQKAFDFYARAASMTELESFQPVLTSILASVKLTGV